MQAVIRHPATLTAGIRTPCPPAFLPARDQDLPDFNSQLARRVIVPGKHAFVVLCQIGFRNPSLQAHGVDTPDPAFRFGPALTNLDFFSCFQLQRFGLICCMALACQSLPTTHNFYHGCTFISLELINWHPPVLHLHIVA